MGLELCYEGMLCEVIDEYMALGDGPYLKIKSSADIDKALSLGFTCMGYPDEIMKKVTVEEITAEK